MLHSTSRGLSARNSSLPMPSRAAVSGRKLCSSTSAEAASRRSTSRAAVDFRLSTMLRLPRLTEAKLPLCPLGRIGSQRRFSSPSGLSTLITSAPKSASICAQYGPASTRLTSITRMPCSASIVWLPSLVHFATMPDCPPQEKRSVSEHIERAHETIHEAHHAHTQGDHSARNVGVLVSILAAALALAEVGEKSAQNEYLTRHIAVSDAWAFYQAKNLRGVVRGAEAELLESLPNAADP